MIQKHGWYNIIIIILSAAVQGQTAGDDDGDNYGSVMKISVLESQIILYYMH